MAQTKQRDLGEAGVQKPKKSVKTTIVERVKRAPVGAKIGTVAGVGALALFGLPALIPVAVGVASLGGFYLYKQRKYSLAMTPERIKVYEQALSSLKDPSKLRVLADEFEKAGCVKEAEHLRKRAALRELSPAEKKVNQNRYRAAMAAMKSSQIHGEADYFEAIGADGAAKNLRMKAQALRAVGK